MNCFTDDIAGDLRDALSPFEDAGVSVAVSVRECLHRPDLIVCVRIGGRFDVLDQYRVSLALNAGAILDQIMRAGWNDFVRLLSMSNAQTIAYQFDSPSTPRLSVVH